MCVTTAMSMKTTTMKFIVALKNVFIYIVNKIIVIFFFFRLVLLPPHLERFNGLPYAGFILIKIPIFIRPD